MFRPSITDYIDSLNNPDGIFRTLGGIVPERDIYGEPLFRAGNSAAIFTFRGEGGERRLLKCYIRPNPHLRTVYDYVERVSSAILPRVRLLRDELYIHSGAGVSEWVDILEGEWTEGETLTRAVVRAARTGDARRLGVLADAFDELAGILASEEWAHGDLKPDNIIVGDNGVARGVWLSLIDCDAMWIPALSGQTAAETGTPAWCNPERTASDFDKRIDDYSIALISERLRAVAAAPERCVDILPEM